MFTSRGPLSEENRSLNLWKAITRYKKTVQTEKRDMLAISIHKAFISDQSKYSLPLSKELLEYFDPDIPHDRPSTASLKQLQKFTEESLKPLIDFFLGVQGGSLSANGRTRLTLAPAPKKVASMHLSLYPSIIQACDHQQLQEDILHLSKTLDCCEGPITQKLKAFSEYLAYNGTQQGLQNNVQFWLEVNKFKVVFIRQY